MKCESNYQMQVYIISFYTTCVKELKLRTKEKKCFCCTFHLFYVTKLYNF